MRTSEAPDGGHGLLDLPDAPHAPALHVHLEAEPPVLGFLLRKNQNYLVRSDESSRIHEWIREEEEGGALNSSPFPWLPGSELASGGDQIAGDLGGGRGWFKYPMCDQGRVSGKRVPLTANQPDWTAQSSMRCCEESDELDVHPVHISQCSNLFIREGGRN